MVTVMCRRRLILLLFAVLMATSAFAQDSSGSPRREPTAEDYSQKALLEIFLEKPDVLPEKSPFETGIVFERGPVRYRWMPIIAPLLIGGLGGSMDTVPMDYVDPFALTGMSFAYTSGSYRDRYSEWRVKRFLRKNVEAANKADNKKP